MNKEIQQQIDLENNKITESKVKIAELETIAIVDQIKKNVLKTLKNKNVAALYNEAGIAFCQLLCEGKIRLEGFNEFSLVNTEEPLKEVTQITVIEPQGTFYNKAGKEVSFDECAEELLKSIPEKKITVEDLDKRIDYIIGLLKAKGI